MVEIRGGEGERTEKLLDPTVVDLSCQPGPTTFRVTLLTLPTDGYSLPSTNYGWMDVLACMSALPFSGHTNTHTSMRALFAKLLHSTHHHSTHHQRPCCLTLPSRKRAVYRNLRK